MAQKLLTEERYRAILELLLVRGAMTIQEFAGELGISESTVRRDLIELDKQGKLLKVRGGATTISSSYMANDRTMLEKRNLNIEEKRSIACRAARMIHSGDVVFVDAGSTTMLLSEFLTEKDALFVTSGIEHAQRFTRLGCRVMMLGGEIKPVTEAAVGVSALNMLRSLNFTLAFLGVNGVNLRAGFTTPDPNEAAVKSEALARSSRSFVLADSSKLGVVTPVTFAPLQAATLITGADWEQCRLYREQTTVLLADEKK